MKYTLDCPCCGNKSTAYTHCLNKSLCNAFVKMVEKYLQKQKPVSLSKDIELTHNQHANFQKLQYFGLVYICGGKNGLWLPTKRGLSFYLGEISVLNPVATLNNELLADDHEAWETHTRPRKRVFINDVDEIYYKQVQEYQAEKSDQTSFLDDFCQV